MEVTESPDRADAVVYAFYPHIGDTGELVQSGRQRHIVGTRAHRKR